MVKRLSSAIILGALITLGVLLAMQALIATPKANLDESGARHFVDFVRVEREEIVQRRDRRPDKPVAPDAPPPQAIQPRVDSVEPSAITVDIPAAPVEVEMEVQGLGLAVSDGEYLPLVKIEPTYPMRALSRGIEGYCLVEYTVTAAGTVKDVVVIEADPPGIFDRVSIEAALKFKYRPRVVNGQPIEVRGVRNIFRYKLES
jgi:protein TonB